MKRAAIFFNLLLATSALRVCDEEDVVQTVEFDRKPVCPNYDDAGSKTYNGTIYLFKPNIDYTETLAHKCQLHKIHIKTRQSAVWHKYNPERYFYKEAVSTETCKRWIESKHCKECTREGGCDFKEIGHGHKAWMTDVPEHIEYRWKFCQEGTWSGTTVNCYIEQGYVRVEHPWKTVTSKWGTLHQADIDDRYRLGAIEEDTTVVWKEIERKDMCSLVLHSDHPAFKIELANGNNIHLAIPKLTVTFTVERDDNQELKSYYNRLDHNDCLHRQLHQDYDFNEMYMAPGGIVLLFHPSHSSMTIDVWHNETSKMNTFNSHHGLKTNESLTENLKRLCAGDEQCLKRIRYRRAIGDGAREAVSDGHLQYFLDILDKYDFDSAVQMAKHYCERDLQLYDIGKILAEIDPSKVISGYLGKNVVVRRQDYLYHILQCMEVQNYTIVSQTKRDKTCYSRPLVLIDSVNEGWSVTDKKTEVEGQVLEDGRVIFSSFLTERCTMSKHYMQSFLIDDRKVHFRGYQLLVGDVRNKTRKISPQMTKIVKPEHHSYQVQHVGLYKDTEGRPLLTASEALDTINNNRRIIDYVKRVIMPADDDENATTENEGITTGFWHSIGLFFDTIWSFFTDPIARLLVVIFFLVPTIFVWIKVIAAVGNKFKERYNARKGYVRLEQYDPATPPPYEEKNFSKL